MSYRSFTRRKLLVGLASTILPPVQPGFAATETLRFIGQNESIKGIDVVPPIQNWNATSYGLSQVRADALTHAGFNTLRVFIPIKEFIYASDNQDQRMEISVRKWGRYVNNVIRLGFKAVVSWSSTYEDRMNLLKSKEVQLQFSTALYMLAKTLVEQFGSELVCIEIMNEPPEESELAKQGLAAWATQFAPSFYRTIRAGAPSITVLIQCASGGWSEKVDQFNLRDFDENTIFCYHFYTPGEFTHQGINYPDIYNVPFPIERYVGGKERMIVDVQTRLYDRNDLSESERAANMVRNRELIDYLWNPEMPLAKTWVKWPILDRWTALNRVNPKRILCGEFGVVSRLNFNGSIGTDVESRANYMYAVRKNVEDRSFGGWIAHQAFGDFNIFQQETISKHGNTLIPEISNALFG